MVVSRLANTLSGESRFITQRVMSTLSDVYIHSVLPVVAVESSVVDGFADVSRFDVVRFGKVSDRSTDTKNLVMSTRGETHVLHRVFQHRFGVGFELTVLSNLLRLHLPVDSHRSTSKTICLKLTSHDDSFTDLLAGCSVRSI